MAEESPSSVSITDEDVVRISKAQYRQAVTQMKQHKLQLVAASNLHRLMREKEEQLAASREENRQLQLALQQSDTRLGNIVRLQAATAATSLPAATHSLEADCANIVLQLPQSDVEEDSANVVQVQSRRKSDVETDSAPQSPHSVTNLTEKPTNKLDSVAVTRTPLTALPSASVTSSPVLESTDACASTHVTCSASSVTTQLTSISPTTTATNPESKDLLDKVLQQNARLKKILRDLLSQKGLSVSTYLDKQEYEDAAEILRHDLVDAQKRICQLKSIIASRNSGDIDGVTQECSRLTDKVAVLERKLAISQAYADALKQAHEQCRHDGSHTESESAAEVSSTNYAQVLKELQKVKDQLKECEMKNETLQTELAELQQQLRENEASLNEFDNLKHQHQELLEERQLNQSQIAAYEEDFKMEQKEKQEQQQRYEVNIAKHQDWVRRLAAEAQKCRASWQEETAKREELENQLRTIQSEHMSPSPGGTSSKSSATGGPCSLSAFPKPALCSLPRAVGVDGFSDASIEKDCKKQRTRTGFTCPRCEREFPSTEESKWKLHCKRCTDD